MQRARGTRQVAVLVAVVATTVAAGAVAAPAAGAEATAPAAGPSWTGSVGGWGLDGEYGAPDVPAGLDDVVASDAHGYAGAVVRADGTAVAWQEGYSDWDLDAWAADLTDVAELAVGGAHLVARHADGTLSAHGWDAYGQSSIPDGLRDVVALDAGGSHNLALRPDGTVVAWGEDREGAASVPDGLSDVVAISAGAGHSLALRADGTVAAWGRNGDRQATPPAGLDDVVAVSAGSRHSVALRADGTVVAWGHRDLTRVPDGLTDVLAVAADHHTLALRADGTVAAWGSPHDTWGGSTSVPTALSSVVDIATGGPFSFVVVAAGAESPLPDTTKPEIRHKGTITKAATSARGARIWFEAEIVDDVFSDPWGWCTRDRGDWHGLGTTRVSCRAEDWAANTSQASYDVRVTWSWSGLRLPTGPDGTPQADHGADVATSFKLTGGSHGASDARATLWWAPVVDGVAGERVQVRDAGTGAERFAFDGWKYVLTWSTAATPGPGTYELTVDLGDGVERTTRVRLV